MKNFEVNKNSPITIKDALFETISKI